MSNNRTIWKYRLDLVDQQNLSMPKDAKVLSVAAQGDELMLWALVDSSATIEPRRVWIVGTGHPITGNSGRFIGTVVMPPFVWHVFVELTLMESIAGLL